MSYDSAVAADSPFHFWKLNGSLSDSGSLANALTGTTPNSSGGPVLAADGYATLNGANRLLSTNTENPFSGLLGTTSAENPFGGSYTVVMGLFVPSGSGAHANGYVMTPHNAIPPGALWIDTLGQLNVAGWGTGYAPTGGSWVHIAYTWDGTSLRLYVNGALQAGPHTGQNAGFGSSGIQFGWDGNTNAIAGSVGISRVAVFTSALSGGQISTLYTNWGTGASSYDTAIAGLSPVNYWKFNGSGSDSGSLANNIGVPAGWPLCGKAGPFGDGFQSVGGVRAYTAEFWINPSGASISGYLQAQWNALPAGSVYLNAGAINSWGGGGFGYSPPASTWTHIALAFDGYNTVLFVNGASNSSTSNVYGAIQTGKFSFGEDGSNQNALSANVGVGRWAYYPYALSSGQVFAHYSANNAHTLGAPAHALFDVRVLGMGQHDRATFQTRLTTTVRAQDTFRVINRLYTRARFRWMQRAGLAYVARATFSTRHPQALRLQATYQTRVRFRGLSMWAAFRVVWPHPDLTATFAVTPQLTATFAKVG